MFIKKVLTAILAVSASQLNFIIPAQAVSDTSSSSSSRIVGYLPDWSYSAYTTLDFGNLTHLNIAFCNPNDKGDISCWIPDSEFTKIVEKAHDNDVKVMAALGGAGGCDNYLNYIDTFQEMSEFNVKIINFCEKFGLDGIDLDIELNSANAVWKYYGDWVDSLRELCDEKDYELSTATAQWVAYGVSDETFAKFDFVNVMAYDNDESKTSHADMDFAKNSLNFFNEEKNISKDKLVLGVPFYGRGYSSDGSLDWNSYVPYKDIIADNLDYYNLDSYNGVAYNGAETIAEKCRLASDYGGIMIWELSQDTTDEYSLLKVIADNLKQERIAGDVNADGNLTVADLVMMQKWLLSVPDATLTDWKAGDLCEDDVIDVFDMCLMRRLLLNKTAPSEQILVTNTEELKTALANAKSGDEIVLAPGEYIYSGSTPKGRMFTGEADGTESAPIKLRSLNADNPAIISGTTTASNYALTITGDWWEISDLIITNAGKGIILDNSSHTIIRNCEVYNIGAEGIHFRDDSSYNTAENCFVHDTGVVSPGYGEAIYVGSAKSTTGYGFDCHYNTITGCKLGPNVAAEHIDVKEYTIGTIIENCIFDGTGMSGENSSKSFVNVKGNDVILRNCVGYRNGCDKITRAFESNQVVDGWGQNFSVYGNKAYMDTSISATDKNMYLLNSWNCTATVWDNYISYEDGELVSCDNEDDRRLYYNCNLLTVKG